MLQSMLSECLHWYICLVKDMVVGELLDEQKRHKKMRRWEALDKARDALCLGADLAKERDHGKRSHDKMDDDQREILDGFDMDDEWTTRAIPTKKPPR